MKSLTNSHWIIIIIRLRLWSCKHICSTSVPFYKPFHKIWLFYTYKKDHSHKECRHIQPNSYTSTSTSKNLKFTVLQYLYSLLAHSFKTLYQLNLLNIINSYIKDISATTRSFNCFWLYLYDILNFQLKVIISIVKNSLIRK